MVSTVKGHQEDLRVQRTRRAVGWLTKTKPNEKKLKERARVRMTICVSVPVAPPAGHGRGDSSKRLHIVHSQLSCCFRKLPDKRGLKPNTAAVTFAVVCVPQVIQCLPNHPLTQNLFLTATPHTKSEHPPSKQRLISYVCVGTHDVPNKAERVALHIQNDWSPVSKLSLHK